MKLDHERIQKVTECLTALLPIMEEELKKDLPDLPDDLLLVEMKAILADCNPFHKTPSSARMRRVLRAAVKLLEEKLANEASPALDAKALR